MKLAIALLFFGFICTSQAQVKTGDGTHFSKVFIIVLENTEYNDALKQPYLKSLLQRGTYLDQFYAVRHPSQPNYIAMTSGDINGVTGDGKVDLNVSNIADLIEAKGLTWKAYAEDFPGDCFTGMSSKNYERKHNPFMSYLNIQKNPQRCANIVNSSQLMIDIENGDLPNYSYYVPDMNNDGHDTNVKFASEWLKKNFDSLLSDPRFMSDMLFVVTFDEGKKLFGKNHIYTMLVGDSVKTNYISKTKVGFYELLRTIEDNFGVGTLGKNDAKAKPMMDIWK